MGKCEGSSISDAGRLLIYYLVYRCTCKLDTRNMALYNTWIVHVQSYYASNICLMVCIRAGEGSHEAILLHDTVENYPRVWQGDFVGHPFQIPQCSGSFWSRCAGQLHMSTPTHTVLGRGCDWKRWTHQGLRIQEATLLLQHWRCHTRCSQCPWHEVVFHLVLVGDLYTGCFTIKENCL